MSPEQNRPSEAEADKLAEGTLATVTVADWVDEFVTQPLESIISIVTLSPSAILPNPPLEENVIVFTPANLWIIPSLTLKV